jgi:hypothetical protein
LSRCESLMLADQERDVASDQVAVEPTFVGIKDEASLLFFNVLDRRSMKRVTFAEGTVRKGIERES